LAKALKRRGSPALGRTTFLTTTTISDDGIRLSGLFTIDDLMDIPVVASNFRGVRDRNIPI